jgi:hypothetical protein
VVLWTKPSEAYFLTLAHTCEPLRSGNVVIEVGGVAGVPGRLRVNDDLLVGGSSAASRTSRHSTWKR